LVPDEHVIKMKTFGSAANQVTKWLAELKATDKVPFMPSGGYVYIYTWSDCPTKKGKRKVNTICAA
jgi:hypothetical protein